MHTRVHRWYEADVRAVEPAVLEQWRAQLLAQPQVPNYATGELPQPFPMHREDGDRWRMPPLIGQRLCGNAQRDDRPHGHSIELTFTGKLTEELHQPEAVARSLHALRTQGCALLQKSCGLGKTVDALAIIASLKLKALVIVHKEFLLNQWRERIAQFLPGARVGLIQGQRCEVDDCDIVLGMLKSLSLFDYPEEALEQFGLVVVDEAHNVCARTMSRCLGKVSSRAMFALSATPQRRDGLDCVLDAWFGPVTYSALREDEYAVVHLIHYTQGKCKPKWIGPPSNRRPNMGAMINDLCADEHRNRIIGTLLADAVQEQRKVLVLSDRREHLQLLWELLQEALSGIQCQVDVDDRQEWVVPELAEVMRAPIVDFYVGGRKRAELKQAESADIILATYAMAKEGLDIRPPPDTLLLATPKADVVQSVGRIMRDVSAETEPLILDILDPFPLFQGLATKRRCFYTERGYKQLHFEDLQSVSIPREHEDKEVQLALQRQVRPLVTCEDDEYPF
jgi:superfamily II DNA or RNA helicase